MTVKVEIASDADATTWEDITDEMYLEGARWAGTASRGEIDTGSGFNWRNDDGTRVIPWRRRIRVTEDATTPDTVIWQGRTVGDERGRGPILTESASMFDVNLVDVNADFGGIPFAGTQRPAEDDTDRIQYLLDTYLDAGQSRGSTVIGDTYFSTANPYALVAHLYENVQLIDWFTHITDITGREFFLTKDYDLFYDVVGSTAYASGLSITDDGPNYTTSFPPLLPQATEDSTEMFTGVRFRWRDGTINVVRSSVETANDQWRTVVVDTSVTTAARATAKANIFLDQFDHSRTSFRCGIEIPATLVDQISWGMTISFRSAACGIFTPSTYRITRLSWELIGEGRWRADMELNYASKFGRASNPGTPPVTGPLPVTPTAVIGTTDLNLAFGTDSDGGGSKTFTNPTNANDNDNTTYTSVGSFAAGVSTNIAYLVADLGQARMVGRLVVWGDYECGTNPILPIPEAPDGGWVIQWADSSGGPWTTPSYAALWHPDGAPLQYAQFDLTTAASHRYWRVRWQRDILVGLGFSCGTDIHTFEIFDADTDTSAAPSSGQLIVEPSFFSNGTTTTGSPTTYPYAPLSLRITVNGIDVSDAVTETDPEAGTYEFSTAPPLGAEIVVRYLSTGQTF